MASILSIVVFVIVALPVIGRRFSLLERDVFRFFFAIPSFLVEPMLFITHFGSVSAVVGICGVLFFLGRRRLSLEIGFMAFIAFYLSVALKGVIGRPRPPVYFTDLAQREWGTAGNGFPSGHAALVTILALSLWPHVEKRFRPLLIVLIVAVCISRVSLGVHAPLDVIAGVCVGVFVVSITRIIAPYIPSWKWIAK